MKTQRVFTWVLVLVVALAGMGAIAPRALAQDGGDGEDDGPDVLITIKGLVEQRDGDMIMIGGVIIAVSRAFNPARLDVGDCVEVTGYMLNDDTLKAVSLEFADDCEEAGEGDNENANDNDDDGNDNGKGKGKDNDNDNGADGGCLRPDHPVLLAYADEFGADYDQLIAIHCDGNGLGNIGRALIIARAADVPFETVWAMLEEGMHWKDVIEELDVDPGKLAPGQAIRADKGDKDKDQDKDQDKGGDKGKDKEKDKEKEKGNAGDAAMGAPGNSQNTPANGGTPPGLGGDKPGKGKGRK